MKRRKRMKFPLKIGQKLYCKYRGEVVLASYTDEKFCVTSNGQSFQHSYGDVGCIIFLDATHAKMQLETLMKYRQYAFFHAELAVGQAQFLEEIEWTNPQKSHPQAVEKAKTQEKQGQKVKGKQDTYREEAAHLEYVQGAIDGLITVENGRYETFKENGKSYFTPSDEEREELVFNRKSATETLKAMQELQDVKKKPYFARMDFNIEEDGHQEQEEIYIGKKAISDGMNHYVYDWRSHIGQTYYMKNQVKFHYEGYHYDLLLRRALQVEGGKLLDYYDEYVKSSKLTHDDKTSHDGKSSQGREMSQGKEWSQGDKVSQSGKSHQGGEMSYSDKADCDHNVHYGSSFEDEATGSRVTDPFLAKLIKAKRNEDKLTDIIATIQDNQNRIITQDKDCNMIVQGCAGSGKTMILLHRLSYLLFNHKELNASQIKIITPNEAFNMTINELSKELELDNIDRLTLEDYYISLLVSYGENEKRYQKLAWQDEQKLPIKFVQHIYSDAFLKMLNEDIKKWYENLMHNVKLSVAYPLLSARSDKLFARDRLIDNLTELNSRIIEVYEYQKHQTHKLEVLKKKATLISDYVDEFNIIRQSPTSLKEVDKVMEEIYAAYRSLEAELEEIRLMKNKPGNFIRRTLSSIGLLNGERKEELVETKLRALEQKVRQLQRTKEDLQRKHKEIEMEMAAVHKELLSPQVIGELTNIQQQIPLTNEAILKQIGRPLLGQIAQICEVPVPKGLYRFKLYIELWILYAFKGPTSRDKYLYIDEGQDIGRNEYALIQSLSRNKVVMNIYGDIHQFIYKGRGISDWNTLNEAKVPFTATPFEMTRLNENYRNTVQITQYVNENIGIKSTPIGVNGPEVMQMTQAEFTLLAAQGKLALKAGTRSAIIIKDINSRLYQEVLKENKNMHLVANLGERLSPQHINILTVPMAKGLEFDTTYVAVEDMNQNEKYIALTRALNQLITVR